MSDDNEFIQIIEDGDIDSNQLNTVEDSSDTFSEAPWVIGIVDDEPSVHEATRLALKNVTIYGKPLKFVSAFSGKEGYDVIASHPDMALVLLDVVMETDDAGLALVGRIRSELDNSVIQIILRTGQPGYAPEEDVIIRYEINSYKTKSELTRSKLFTTLATGLRSYQQLQAIEQSRNGLRAVIKASASLIQERSVFEFSSGVLQQIDALFNLSADSLFCVSQRPLSGPFAINEGDDGFYIVAANDKFQPYFGQDVAALQTQLPVFELVQKTINLKAHFFEKQFSCLYLSTPSGWEGVIVAENSDNLQNADQELLQIFCMNVALGLENAKFFSYLNKAAFNDELTNLYNRAGLVDKAPCYFKKHSCECALYLIDIDYFHQVIASLGYEFGNQILQKVADILRRLFGDDTIISRVHSDAYAVLIANSRLSADEVAVKCSRPIVIEGQSIRMGLTVGLATMEYQQGNTPDIAMLLRRAEMALNVAKEQKRGSGETFNEEYEVASRKSMTLLSDLRMGLDQKELFLVLQPKVDANTRNVIGYEALLRWQHPKKGMIPPGAFIASVEKSGMYYELDLYVASALCELINAYPQLNVPVSFNISANSLNHETFVHELKSTFVKQGVDFDQVEIEVTENALIHSEQSISRLKFLYDAGFEICLDDFGAGFSSLSYLLRLPLHTIKIDRAFVADVASNRESLTLIKGIIDIIQNLNKEIVIEGVENERQLEALIGLGVTKIQGFYFYKPMPVAAAIALLAD